MTRMVLVALTGLLGAILIAQWWWWPPGMPLDDDGDQALPLVSAQPPDVNALLDLLPDEPKETYTTIQERPIFRPDRRPEADLPEEGEEVLPAGPDTLADLAILELSAVIIAPTLTSALLRDPRQPDLRRIREGDLLEGWTVARILPDRVQLERQGEQHILLLRDYSKTLLSPPVAPPVPRRPPRPPFPPTQVLQ